MVNVGIDKRTMGLAQHAVLRCWNMRGDKRKPLAKMLPIVSDVGSSNGRLRVWNVVLQEKAVR